MRKGVVERMTTKTSHHSRHLGGEGGVDRDHEIQSENACSESGTSRSCRIRGLSASSGSDSCRIPVSLAFTCVLPKAYASLLRQTKQQEKGV